MVWMDVYEVEEEALLKGAAEEIARPPLVPSERNNAVTRKPKPTREIQSRYKAGITSPSLSTPAVTRRCPSPNVTRTVRQPSPTLSKRAHSAERRRASPPASPVRPSTPVRDTSIDMQSGRRRIVGGRTSEGLWPSTTTMRSLSVSFQSDTFSLPVSKKEKPSSDTSDHALKPSSNVARKRSETPQRKATPERKRSPLRGKNDSNHLENAKPRDNRVVDQQRLPSRSGGKLAARTLTRSVDLTDKPSRANSLPSPVRGSSPLRRLPSSDGTGKGLRKSRSEVGNQLSLVDSGRVKYEMCSADDASLRSSGPQRMAPSNVGISSTSSERPRSASGLSERPRSASGSSRWQSMPTTLTRPPSPSKAPMSTPISSRGLSPSRTRPLTPFPSVSSTTNRSVSSSSVLSFIADVKRGKKVANHIEDAHQLRLLYNRHLQWRYANAQADVILSIQKETAEETFYNVWTSTSELRDSVSTKRISLQLLKQDLKLNSVLNEQMAFLDAWGLLEDEHSSSLSGAVEALEACTLRLPVTGGARADTLMVKDAICSAVDVMQSMGSSICSSLSRVEGMSNLICELAEVAARGKTMLNECEQLLALTSAMQVKENSLRTHLIQLNQALRKREQPMSAIEIPL